MPLATIRYAAGTRSGPSLSVSFSCGVFLLVAYILFIPNILYSGNFSEAYICYKSSNIIITASEEALLIKPGGITAQEGYSVRLLPGTRITSTESFAVTIVSQDNYEKLSAKLAKQERDAAVASVIKHKPPKDRSLNLAMIANGFDSRGRNPFLTQKQNYDAFLPVRTQQTPAASGNTIHKETIIQPSIKPALLAYQIGYHPVMSWGKRAENIRVMLS